MKTIGCNGISRRALLGSGALLAAAMARPAWAAPASLRIGMAAAPSAMDPHYHLLATNQSVLSHIFEPLVRQDEAQRPVPGLATSWKLIDDKTWEFRLREGVAFHDGSPFGAEDVVFSLGRVPKVPNSPSSYAIFLKQIATTEIVSPFVIRFHTQTPYLDLPIDLSQIAIMSAKAAAGPAAEGKTTQQLNAGDGTVGTGPYRFVSFTPNDKVVLAANPTYWGGAQPWAGVVISAMSQSASRVAAVLSGDVDLIEKVPGEDLEEMRANKAVRVMVAPSNSIFYLCFDQARDVSPAITDAGGRNPLRDARVRQALSMSINRELLAERILSGLGDPAAELVAPGMVGATPGVKVEAFDPEGARKLLAEAGYPNGFGITLITTNGFYVQDAQLAQAIASFWTRVGVRAKVEALPPSVFYTRRNSRDFSAYITSMSLITGQASDTLKILAATQDLKRGLGQTNFGGYSNPKVDALIETAMQTMDPAAKDLALRAANEIVGHADHGVLPIAIEKIGYATRAGISYTPRADKWVTAMQAK